MADPIKKFGEWFELVLQSGENEPTAMCLATVDEKHRPSARIVLLKSFNDLGFVFYTNGLSRKGRDLAVNQEAALCFYWSSVDKQVQIKGRVEKLSAKEADVYFASRPRGSQLGAWASQQSSELVNREDLKLSLLALERKYLGQTVPRPEYWVGYRLKPQSIEFWSKGENRLHDREFYTKKDVFWERTFLYP